MLFELYSFLRYTLDMNTDPGSKQDEGEAHAGTHGVYEAQDLYDRTEVLEAGKVAYSDLTAKCNGKLHPTHKLVDKNTKGVQYTVGYVFKDDNINNDLLFHITPHTTPPLWKGTITLTKDGVVRAINGDEVIMTKTVWEQFVKELGDLNIDPT